jgi:hypothetical protein
MILVVASGLVGRFLYRKIHHGLYGSEATLKELEQKLARRLEALEPLLRAMPAVKQEMDRFAALVSARPERWHARAGHFLSLGAKRLLAGRRVRRAIAAQIPAGRRPSSRADFTVLLKTMDASLRAVQRSAQFSTYERLFSLWHAIHLPFLGMLVITAVIHVVAVHMY